MKSEGICAGANPRTRKKAPGRVMDAGHKGRYGETLVVHMPDERRRLKKCEHGHPKLPPVERPTWAGREFQTTLTSVLQLLVMTVGFLSQPSLPSTADAGARFPGTPPPKGTCGFKGCGGKVQGLDSAAGVS